MKRAGFFSEQISAKRSKMDCAGSAIKIQAAWRGYSACAQCVAPHLRGMLKGKQLLRTLFGCLAKAGIRTLETLRLDTPDIRVDECEILYCNSLMDINDVVTPYIGVLVWNRDSPTLADTFWQAKHAVSTFDKFSSHKLCKDWVHSVLRTVKSVYFVQCEMLAEYAENVYSADDLESANGFCDDLQLYLISAFMMPYEVSAAQNIQRTWRGYYVRMIQPLHDHVLAPTKSRAEKNTIKWRIYKLCRNADDFDHTDICKVRNWLINVYLHVCHWKARWAPAQWENIDQDYQVIFEATYHAANMRKLVLDFSAAIIGNVFHVDISDFEI